MLFKIDKEYPADFYDHYLNAAVPRVKIGAIVSVSILLILGVLLETLYPDNLLIPYLRTFWIVVPLILALFWLAYKQSHYKYLNIFYYIISFLICLLIFYLGTSAGETADRQFYYTFWVIMIIMGFFSVFRFPVVHLVVTGSLLVLAYILASIVNRTFSDNNILFLFGVFFVLAIYSIGILMALSIRKLYLKNFIDQTTMTENYNKLLKETEERKYAQQELLNSEIQYHNTLNAIPDWIYVIDKELRIVMINDALQEEHIRQGFPIDCTGKKLNRIYPLIPKTTLDEIQHVFSTGEVVVGEQKFFLKDKSIFGEIRKVPIFKDKKVVQVMVMLHDRSKAREIEELKQRNTEQKEVMLREIHHRVKNNLAIVISMLGMQIRQNSDPALVRIIHDIEMRIRSMALIHEHLYRSEHLDRIPLSGYLHALINIINSTFRDQRIRISADLDPVDVSIEIALPLGLIANELLTNAFKYAFPDHEEGEIIMELKQSPENITTLTIRDNGVGLPESVSFEGGKTLGMFIVKLLVEQLDGTIEVIADNGTSYRITFTNIYQHNHSNHIV